MLKDIGDRTAYSAENLGKWAKDKDIRLVALMHVGTDGWIRTLDFAPQSESHLKDILEGGERADGSNLFAGTGIPTISSDVLIRPRLDTAFLDPFADVPTLAFLCEHIRRDGQALPESPNTLVHHAYRRLQEETGVDLWALGEVEYFLGRKRGEADIRAADERGYHAASPVVFGEALRRKALLYLREMGVPTKYGHSEVGYLATDDTDGWIWEQHEIELGLAPLPQAADNIILTQWIVRNLAQREGVHVNFDPILRQGHAGSGLHIHFSPKVNGQDQGSRGTDGNFPDAAQWLIGGLVTHSPALMAFGNRSPAAFTRLSQGKEAPSRITWGEYNRLALVRIPTLAFTKDGRVVNTPTIEFRLPDGSAHPYLLLAGVAQAMAAASRMPNLSELLVQSSADNVGKTMPPNSQLPPSFPDIAVALEKMRDVFTAGDVFPSRWIDLLISKLHS